MGYPKWAYDVYDKEGGTLLGSGIFGNVKHLFSDYDGRYESFRYYVVQRDAHDFGGRWVVKRPFEIGVDEFHRNYKAKRTTPKYDRDIWTESSSEPEIKKKRMTKTERLIDMIERHLDIYGNTFTNKDPKKLIPILNEHGYSVDVDYQPKRIEHYPSGAIEVWNEIWILTLKGRKTEYVV